MTDTQTSAATSEGNGEDIGQRYKEANKLVLEIRSQMERLEAGESADLAAGGQLSANINALSRLSDGLERSVAAGRTGSRQELWRIRVRQLSEECKVLRSSAYEYMSQRDRRARETEERAQLLEGRVSSGEAYSRQTRMGYLVDESQALSRATAVAEDIESSGGQILDGLERQSALVKGMRRKVLDMMGTLGLSRSVMKMFSRRTAADRLLVFGGMVVTLIVLLVLYFYFA